MVNEAFLAKVRDVLPIVRAHADEAEALRRLPPATVAALASADLFRMCVPRVYGGPEIDPLTMLAAIEEVSAADGAAGWCANISSTTSSVAAFIDPEWARRVFGDPVGAYGGTFAPNGRGREVEGGWTVSGRWSWGSGIHHCTWVMGGTVIANGEMHNMIFDPQDVTIHDTWYSSGLRGTGSTDFEVNGAFVPRGREVHVLKGKMQADCPLARFPNFNLLAAGLAAVAIGIARRAVDEAVALAREKKPAMQRQRLAEYEPAQLDIAHAEARLRSARAFVRDQVAVSWEAILRGDRVSTEQKAQTRLACHFAAKEAAAATDLAYGLCGGSSVFTSSPLQRCFRDVHTATQHMMLGDRNAVAFAKLRLGLDADTAML